MDISEIFNFAREQAGGVSTIQFPDATLLKYAQIARNKMSNALIRKVDENYFYDILTADLIADQNEYILRVATWAIPWMKKVINVEVLRKTTNTNYDKLKQSSTTNSTMSLSEQASSPDQADFFQIRDGSIFLFPTPTETVTNWLKVEAILSQPDLTVDTTEEEIFPYNSELRDYHQIIWYWIVPFIFGKMKQKDLQAVARNDFDNEINIMCDELSDRYNNNVEWDLPNWDTYK